MLHEALVNSTRGARGPPLFPWEAGSRGARRPRRISQATCKEMQLKRAPDNKLARVHSFFGSSAIADVWNTTVRSAFSMCPSCEVDANASTSYSEHDAGAYHNHGNVEVLLGTSSTQRQRAVLPDDLSQPDEGRVDARGRHEPKGSKWGETRRLLDTCAMSKRGQMLVSTREPRVEALSQVGHLSQLSAAAIYAVLMSGS